MAISGLCIWFRWIYSLFVVVLPMAAGMSQTKGTDDARFTKIVVPTGGDPDALAAADVNHDGAMDIIAANLEQGTVSVLLGNWRHQSRWYSRSRTHSLWAAGERRDKDCSGF
jgi:hypothetical protein